MRRILRDAGVRWQATKTWKASRDPQFRDKRDRILDLYDRSAAGQIADGGRVICVDEFGPLNLQPRPGLGWFPAGRPSRLRATYNRYGGCGTCSPGSISPRASCSTGSGDRKRSQEFLEFLRQLRRRFPTGRLFVVCDNLSPHRKATVVAWCTDGNVMRDRTGQGYRRFAQETYSCYRSRGDRRSQCLNLAARVAGMVDRVLQRGGCERPLTVDGP